MDGVGMDGWMQEWKRDGWKDGRMEVGMDGWKDEWLVE